MLRLRIKFSPTGEDLSLRLVLDQLPAAGAVPMLEGGGIGQLAVAATAAHGCGSGDEGEPGASGFLVQVDPVQADRGLPAAMDFLGGAGVPPHASDHQDAAINSGVVVLNVVSGLQFTGQCLDNLYRPDAVAPSAFDGAVGGIPGFALAFAGRARDDDRFEFG